MLELQSKKNYNKDDLTKENARIQQVLKENRYQGNIISKMFPRITNSHSLSQSQQQNASHKYSKGKDRKEYKFTVR